MGTKIGKIKDIQVGDIVVYNGTNLKGKVVKIKSYFENTENEIIFVKVRLGLFKSVWWFSTSVSVIER